HRNAWTVPSLGDCATPNTSPRLLMLLAPFSAPPRLAEVVDGAIAFPEYSVRRRAVVDGEGRQTGGGRQNPVADYLTLVVDGERKRDSVTLRYERREYSLNVAARPADYRLKAVDLKGRRDRAAQIERAMLRYTADLLSIVNPKKHWRCGRRADW